MLFPAFHSPGQQHWSLKEGPPAEGPMETGQHMSADTGWACWESGGTSPREASDLAVWGHLRYGINFRHSAKPSQHAERSRSCFLSLQMRKQRPTEGPCLAQGHIGGKHRAGLVEGPLRLFHLPLRGE